MNLHELHTRHPLRDSDFAAIRARVKGEIARREERAWLPLLLRFAFAAALFVLFVPHVRHRAPAVPVAVVKRVVVRGPLAAPPAGRAASPPPTRVAARDAARPAGETPALHTQAARIEIITADPTIRIIWITPKESS